MPEWNPDKKELEVILDKLDIMAEKSDSVFIGEEEYKIEQIREELRNGTPLGRELYENHMKAQEMLKQQGYR